MDLKVIDGTAPEAQKICDWLVGIYNESSKFQFKEKFKIKDPESVCIAYIEGLGGIIIDLVRHKFKLDVIYTICHFLCVEKEYRGEGYARQFVDIAREISRLNNITFIGAYTQSNEEFKLWERMGYGHQGNIGMTISMTNSPLESLLQ